MQLGLQRGAAGGVCGCLAEENGRRPSLSVTGGETLSGPSAQLLFSVHHIPPAPPQLLTRWGLLWKTRRGQPAAKGGGFEELEGKGVKKREKRRKEKAVLMFPPLNPKPCWVIRTATDQEPQVKLVGGWGSTKSISIWSGSRAILKRWVATHKRLAGLFGKCHGQRNDVECKKNVIKVYLQCNVSHFW